jgi:DNA-binding CsgD family transcriptional regulator
MVKDKSISRVINENFIRQATGSLLVMDINSKFLTASETALKWTGFKSYTALEGASYCDMPCKIAEEHDVYVAQNMSLLACDCPLSILGYFCYANDDWKVIFGKKYLVKNQNGQILALVSHFNDITNYNLINLNKILDITINRYSVKVSRRQVSYVLDDNYSEVSLSKRQSECMFFLLRGKTAKDIAKILNLSPRTIEDHIDQIKLKLNCTTKSELLEKAIAYGYMNIIPKSLLINLKC